MPDDLIVEFISEATDHLARAEEHLLVLGRAGGGEVDLERVNACFRALHTIKGICGFLSLPRILRLSHAGEQVLDALRTRKVASDDTVYDALLATVSRLRDQVQHLAEGGHEAEGDDGSWIRLLESLLILAAPTPVGPCLAAEPAAIELCLAGIITAGATDPAMARSALDDLVATMSAGGWCPVARACGLKMRFLAESLSGQEGDPVFGQVLNLIEGLHAAGHGASGADGAVPPAVEPATGDALADFIAESNDLLAAAEAIAARRSAPSQDEVNAVFRSFHTIKGMAAYLGQPAIEAMAHGYETRLVPYRDGVAAVADLVSPLVLEGVDALRRLVSEARPLTPAMVPAHPPRRAAPAAAPPALADPLPEPAGVGPAPIPEADAPGDRLGDLLVAQGVPRPVVEAAAQELRPGERLGDRLVGTGGASRQQVEGAAEVQRQVRSTGDGFSRVATTKLEELMNQVGELLIAQALVQHDPELPPASRLAQSVSQQGRILRNLQMLSLSLRLVPLRGTFQKMARAIHDTARRLGKQVELHLVGEDTEIDRTMAEGMADPLLHMVRNAVDHGIESADERQQRGKPGAGSVTLEAFQAGDDVVIRLADDGAGMDPRRLRAKAVEKGLIPADQHLSDQECFQLVFLPGFSTAAQVTDVSGRGVGMDVVRRQVEAANGRVQIDSVVGRGTTFTLRLPLTTAILDALLLRVGGQQFLIPTTAVVEMLRPQPGQLQQIFGRGLVIEHRGRSLPVVDLADRFAIPTQRQDSEFGILLVVESRAGVYALQVDDITGQRQVVIKPFDRGVTHHPGVSGSAILGDGRVGLILNPGSLLHSQTLLEASA